MNMTRIFGIGLIALIAMIGISAVSAEPVERTVLGTEWNYDVVGDDCDYFIYDGTSDVASADGWLRESIGGSDDVIVGAWNYTPAPVPVIPDYELRAGFNVDDWNGYTAGEFNPAHPEPTIVPCDALGYFHSGDFPRGSAEDTTSMEFGDI